MSGLNVEIKRTPTNGIYIYADGVRVAKTDYSKESEQFIAWIEQCKANEDRNEVAIALHKQNVSVSFLDELQMKVDYHANSEKDRASVKDYRDAIYHSTCAGAVTDVILMAKRFNER